MVFIVGHYFSPGTKYSEGLASLEGMHIVTFYAKILD